MDLRLIEALEIANRPQLEEPGEPFEIALACGFTPLHLATFLHARIRQQFSDRKVTFTGPALYGDLIGNLKRLTESRPNAAAVVVEWQDLDPRLGVRQLGGWSPEISAEIVANAPRSLARLQKELLDLSAVSTVAVCPPTLPLPPFSNEAGWQAGPSELRIREAVSAFLAELAEKSNVRVVSSAAFPIEAAGGARFDVRSELNAGFPYTNAHANAVAELLAKAIRNSPPKKGIITDLDDTLWRGILGDAGIDGVSWDLANKAALHGLYQQFLAALAQRGVLVGVVSKNDPKLVAQAFEERKDLLVGSNSLFPIEAGWGPKSDAVARVIRAWNIGADSVVFVDDSEMELAEVKCAHPGVQTFRFPVNDPQGLWNLLLELQDLFGKPQVLDEDRIRAVSLRTQAEFDQVSDADGGAGEDDFIAGLKAEITFDSGPQAADARALELLNKTNQFNLNGKRIEEGQWRSHLADPRSFLLVVSYKDKFGPLGKIAVLTGLREASRLHVTSWVMSCRAFARRIEHQCMRELFDWSGLDEVELDYQTTPRNGPTTEFLTMLNAANLADGPVRIRREDFESRCPQLFHTVTRSNA